MHEGYLVTPITKFELVAGLNIAGAVKGYCIMAGVVITVLEALLSGLGTLFLPLNLFYVFLMISGDIRLAFNTMMFLMMVRVEDPLVPRATFGILNTLLFFPSGAIYPIKAFPAWLRWIAYIDPFTYSVHGFKALLLKDAGFVAIRSDLIYLTVSAFLMITLATALFKRTL